jgi:hypothetical protein
MTGTVQSALVVPVDVISLSVSKHIDFCLKVEFVPRLGSVFVSPRFMFRNSITCSGKVARGFIICA